MQIGAKCLQKLGSHPSKDIGTLTSLMTFTRDGSKVLEKDILGLYKCQKAFKMIYISMGQRSNL